MTYLSAKKIYPGNWVNALNGWYKNTDANPVDGTNDSTVGGPTSVLADPGYRYFQQRGYHCACFKWLLLPRCELSFFVLLYF